MQNDSKLKMNLFHILQNIRLQFLLLKKKGAGGNDEQMVDNQNRYLKKLLLVMHRATEFIAHENDPRRYIQDACKHLEKKMGLTGIWIAWVDKTGSIQDSASSGANNCFENLSSQLKIGRHSSWFENALKTPGIISINDSEVNFCREFFDIERHEKQLGISCRIEYENRTYGVIAAFITEGINLNSEKKNCLLETANDLGFALYRFEAEKMPKNQESLMACVYQNIPLMMILLDEKCRVQKINRLACDYLGRPGFEIIGKPCGEVLRCLHSQNNSKGCGFYKFCENCKFRLTIKDTLETGRNYYHVEATLPFEIKGKEKNLTLLLYTTYLQFHKKAMVLVTILDISERKRSERALKRREKIFRCFIENAPDAVIVYRDTRLVYLNPSSVCLLGGQSQSQFIGGKLIDYFHPDCRKELTEKFQILNDFQTPFHSNDQFFLRLDGTRVPVDLSAVPITFYGNKSALVFVRDISERKKIEKERSALEQKVRQAEKLDSLGVLAGGIAHDFNNILMIVMGHAELALEWISKISAARENIRDIVDATQRAADLCRQMLAYAGKDTFNFEITNLSELIGEMIDIIKTSISNKTILNVYLSQGALPILADPGQIRRIIMNLITNASEAIGDQEGVIDLKVDVTQCDEDYLLLKGLNEKTAPGTYVYFEISDTGCGIANDVRERIFDPFYSTKFTGRGLGLASVMGIVRVHRGALDVISEPGKGTTVKVFFPVMKKQLIK